MKQQLAALRETVSHKMAIWLGLHVPVAGIAGYASGNGIWAPAVAAAVVAGVAGGAAAMAPAATSTRLTIAVAYVAMVSILVAACGGSLVQLDLHMYYFAALALLTAFCDRDVILAAAGATALHHLGLNFLAPGLVFPDGANLPRVVLHAVIIVIETAALVWIIAYILNLLGESERHLAAVEEAAAAAARAQAEADLQRGSAEEERRGGEVARLAGAAQLSAVVGVLAEGLAKLAAGELRGAIDVEFPAAYEALRADFNAALRQLQEAMRLMLSHTSAIRVGTAEIVAASDDLAKRTEQQAAVLEGTVSALGRVTNGVRVTASQAARAREVVTAASEDTRASSSVVAEAVEAMGGIASSSQQIGKIVGVIEDIAFQTNLLALNAGVEAARAGDAGRGFAVVATEVRALAQRSADAAKEIKILIGSSETQVTAGVERVGRTGAVLVRLAAQVGQIDGMVSEISASAADQAQSLSQVNEAVAEMEQSTQRTAAMVQETNAATRALSDEVGALVKVSRRFDVGRADALAVPAGRRRAALADG